MAKILRMEDVAYNIDHRFVLTHVNLELDSGIGILICGANGVGKTTLLLLAATLLEPHAGKISWFDQLDAEQARGHLGLLSHPCYFYDALSGQANLRLVQQLWQRPYHAVDQVLVATGLFAAKDTLVAYYSAGMKQRLAIARLQLLQAPLLLLDEPWSALDTAGTVLVDQLIESHLQQGNALLLTTHDLQRGQKYCQQQYTLKEGQLWPFRI